MVASRWPRQGCSRVVGYSIPKGQEATKPARVGFIAAPIPVALREAFQQGLHDLGYVEGNTLAIEYREPAGGKTDQYATLASELVAMQVSVLVAAGSLAITAARDSTRTIPIVMAAAEVDPV